MRPFVRTSIASVLLCLALLVVTGCGRSALVAPTAGPTIGEQREATLFWSQAEREAGFRRMSALFPSDIAAPGAHVRPLPQGEPLPLDAGMLDDYMDRHHIAGLMVLHDGEVRLERYGLEFGPDQRWESYSVAKSVTSTLLGIAMQEEHVGSLDDALPTYIPELSGSAYDGVTVGQLLTMTSGVRWNEDYACFKMQPQRRFSGIWLDEFEGSVFLEGVTEPSEALRRIRAVDRRGPAGEWLGWSMSLDDLDPSLRRALERSATARLVYLEFDGRRTAYRGRYGHMGMSESEVIVDRVIAARPVHVSRFGYLVCETPAGRPLCE